LGEIAWTAKGRPKGPLTRKKTARFVRRKDRVLQVAWLGTHCRKGWFEVSGGSGENRQKQKVTVGKGGKRVLEGS